MAVDSQAKLKKVLFLDVDGVLHPLRMECKDGKLVDDHCFNPSCMAQLQCIVQSTGAELVLSSSWRCFEGPRARLADALASYGLGFKCWITTQILPGGRPGQVLSWVSDHCQELGSWAVVDDEPLVQDSDAQDSMMMQVFASRFVKTQPDVGLTQVEANQLIALLNEDSSDEEASGAKEDDGPPE